MNRLFKRTGSARPGKSVFDLSYRKLMTANMGILYPVIHDEAVPGDVFEFGVDMLIRLQPLVAPAMHPITATLHVYFVPDRLLMSVDDYEDDVDWETFITGGEDGDDESDLPRWSPSSTAVGSLWDYFGFPTGVTPTGRLPLAFPLRAYNKIWNTYYRDVDLDDEINEATSEVLLRRRWEKDYFTSARSMQQLGTAPALPVSGMVPVTGIGKASQTYGWTGIGVYETDGSGTRTYSDLEQIDDQVLDHKFYVEEDPDNAGFPNIRADLSKGTTFDVSDFRTTLAVQHWMERNMRGGVRYNEFLRMHFGDTGYSDARLDRPEYIGGSRVPVVISEVLQTSETGTTAQGTLAGHGMSVDSNFVGKYRVPEYGVFIGLLSIMPKAVYSQGINRQWLRQDRYDFYHPEFANLSEQAIEEVEIYATGVESQNKTIFGYQGNYDEMRVKHSMYCGQMRIGGDFDYWHLGRNFSSRPTLNSAFIECDPGKRIFAVQDEDTFICTVGNRIRAVRPMPAIAVPGVSRV